MFLNPGGRQRPRPHNFGPAALVNDYINPGGRISLTSSVPITESDVTGATNVFLVPYESNWGSWYNGTTWQSYQYQGQPSMSLQSSVHTSCSAYDVYDFLVNGKPLIGTATAWTSTTTRSSLADITLFQGVYVNQSAMSVNTGSAIYTVPALTARLRGGFRTISIAGQTEDSLLNRYVWDMYRPVWRPMKRVDTTTSWTLNSSSFRQANGSTANQVNWFQGVAGRPVNLRVQTEFISTSAAIQEAGSGIGIDSTTFNSASITSNQASDTTYNQFGTYMDSEYAGYPGIGYHQGVWLEYGTVATFYGNNGASQTKQNGILGFTIQ